MRINTASRNSKGMSEAPSREGSNATDLGRLDGRADQVLMVPWNRLFYPDPDPTEPFPEESADIEGYHVAPDHTITIAVVVTSAGGLGMLDAAWAVLHRKGVGLRRMLLLDDRGRTVSLMTLGLGSSRNTLDLLRTMLVVPVRARGGFAEVHFLATPEEAGALEERLGKGGPAPPNAHSATLPAAKETKTLRPEDWAFLGFLSSVGAFNGPEGPTPEILADLLGIDSESFAERACAVELGMEGLVAELFALPPPGSKFRSVPSRGRND